MRRVIAATVIVAALGAFALLTGAAKDEGSDDKPVYWIQLDNAFGLIQGADFKVSGVRAGKITELRLTRVGDGYKALVGVQLTAPNIQRLRTDVTCESKPQSLIGEYFVDCNPGRSPTALAPGSTVPVDRTYSTIPTDLVNNVLRLPQRERLRIILNELGAGVAARGEDLNDVIRRAVPALRATDELLKMLADENQTIVDLTVNADHVVTTLAANRTELSRFIREARDTSAATADRRVAFRRQFQLLPGFLRQLRPTMVELGRVADAQIPTLRDLNAASPQLKRFLNDLVPFAQASRPSISTLGQTANVGRFTIPPAKATVEQLGKFTEHAPELSQNLEIVLEDLYDRKRAVEPDPRAPGGEGWNGFEALLMYAYYQSQAINIFDRNGYILKVAVYSQGDCNEYHNQGVKHEPEVYEKCASQLGPNQPGIFNPDPSNKNSPDFNDFPDDVNGDDDDDDDDDSSAQAAQAQQEATILNEASRAAGPAPQPGRSDDPASQAQPPDSQPQPEKGAPPQQQAPAVDISASLKNLVGGVNGVADNIQAGPAGADLPFADDDDVKDGEDGKGNRDREGGAEELLDYLMRR